MTSSNGPRIGERPEIGGRAPARLGANPATGLAGQTGRNPGRDNAPTTPGMVTVVACKPSGGER